MSPAVSQSLGISVATGLYGISFGALGVAAGLSVPQVVVLSLFMFTGGSQFAFIGVLAGGGGGAAAFGAGALLGVRNAVYGMQINALVRPGLTPIAAHVTIDESTAMALGQEAARERRVAFWVTGVGIWVLWNLFTVVGALLGASLGDPKAWGLDGAAVAAFLGLLWPRLKGREPWALAVVAGLVTVLVAPLVPPGLPILVAAVVAAAWGLWVPEPGAKTPLVWRADAEGAGSDGPAGPEGSSGSAGPAGASKNASKNGEERP